MSSVDNYDIQGLVSQARLYSAFVVPYQTFLYCYCHSYVFYYPLAIVVYLQ